MQEVFDLVLAFFSYKMFLKINFHLIAGYVSLSFKSISGHVHTYMHVCEHTHT